MNATKCPTREVLAGYHAGDLPEASADEVIAHLSQCPGCQAAVKTLGGSDDSLISGLRRTPAKELYTDEPQCREFIERAKAMAEATHSNVAPEAGTSTAPGAGHAPGVGHPRGDYQHTQTKVTSAKPPGSPAGKPEGRDSARPAGRGQGEVRRPSPSAETPSSSAERASSGAKRASPSAGEMQPTELFTDKPSSSAAVPTQLREYRILEKLGQGGMGAVFKALHTRLDKLVALKVLPAESVQDSELVARFDREMKAVGKLEHPNIVRAMDAGCHEGTRFLVMEFVDGMDLGGIVKRCGQLRIADACEVIRQAALGLRHADEHALVHRDIKPSNLVLNADGVVKILDLGLALLQADRLAGDDPDGFKHQAASHDATGSGRAMGTLDYMAPEQVRDSHSVDIRADIYSLGCTLYKLLVGQAPFTGTQYENTFDKMMAHLNDPFPPIGKARPDVPEKLAAVLQRMVAKDRDSRYAKPSQVVEDLKPFCSGSDLAGLLVLARKGAKSEPPAASPTPGARGTGLPTPPKKPTGKSPELPAGHEQKSGAGRPAGQAKGGVRRPAPSAQPKPGAPAGQQVPAETAFDPYYKWLSIPPEEQPPNYYCLLGTRLFEEDRDVIQNAAAGRSAHLRTFALGKHSLLSQRLLSEIEVAKVCLLTPEDKIAYDARLRQELASKAAAVPAAEEDTFARLSAEATLPPALWPQSLHAKKSVASRVRSSLRHVPPFAWVAGSFAAAVALLGVVIYIATGKGTVKIEISDPNAKVEVKIDGDQIDIAGLKDLLRLSVGEHKLTITGPDFQAVGQSFTVRRGENEPLRITLVPVESKSSQGQAPANATEGDTPPIVTPRTAQSPTPPIAIAPFDAAKAGGLQKAWAQYLGVPAEMTNSIGMKFVLIPPGEFDMGSSEKELNRLVAAARKRNMPAWYLDRLAAEAPGHRVKLAQAFFLGASEVTRAQYQQVMRSDPSALEDSGANVPAEQVSWNEAMEFCRRLSAAPREKEASGDYRLPTEAEWEYASRAGAATSYCFGDDEAAVSDYAWWGANSGGKAHAVGLKRSNAFGLFDLHGNLGEWCADWFDAGYYRQSPMVNPTGPISGKKRVIRGGSWMDGYPEDIRCAARAEASPDERTRWHGFRVVCEIAGQPAAGETDRSQSSVPGVPQSLETERQRADNALDLAERLRYATTVKSAVARLESGHYGGVPELLRTCKKEFRNWEWGYLMSRCPQPEWKLQANKGPICALAVSPDGKSFVSAGEDDSLVFWDLEKDARRWECTQQGPIRDAAIDPAGGRVVARCGPRFLAFDARSGKALHDSGDVGASALCLSGDGKRLYVAAQGGQRPPTLRVYSTGDWKAGTPVDTESLPSCLAIGSDGQYLVGGEPKGGITVYDAKTLRTTGRKRGPDGFPVKSLAIDSVTGVAVFTSQMYVHQMSLSERRGGGRSFVHPQATCAAVDSDRGVVVSSGGDGTVQFVRLGNGTPIGTIEQGGGISLVAVMPQGGILTGDPQGMVRYWKAPAGPRPDPCVDLRGTVNTGTHVAFRGDGKLLALQGWPADKIVVYDTETWKGKEYPIPGAFERLARFRPGTTQIAITFDDSVRLFETKDGEFRLAAKIAARGKVYSGNFNRSGELLFVAYDNGGVELLDADARRARPVDFGDKQTRWIGAAISPDGRRAAAMKRRQTCVQVWDTETGRELYHIQSDEIRSVEGLAFSPDGGVLAVAGWPGILLLDAASGRRIGRLDGHTGTTPGLAFSPDGHRLLSASTDMSVRIWDWRAGQELLRFPNAHYMALDVACSSDGIMIASTDSGPGGRARQALPWTDDHEERAGPLPMQAGDAKAKHNTASPVALSDETKGSATEASPPVAALPKAAASTPPDPKPQRLAHAGREVSGASNTPIPYDRPAVVAKKPVRKLQGRATIVAATIEDVPEDARKRLETHLAAKQQRATSGRELIAIVGRVAFADGTAVRGPSDVGMGIDSGSGGALPVWIHDDGWFTATSYVYPQQTAVLKVFAYKYHPLYVPFPVGKSGVVRFDITLEPAQAADFGELRVSVVDSKGKPTAGATVTLRMGLTATHGIGSIPESLKAVTTEDGTCVFPIVPGGQYYVGSRFVVAEKKATAVKLTHAVGSQ